VVLGHYYGQVQFVGNNLTDVYHLHGGCTVFSFHLWFYPDGMWKFTWWMVTSLPCFNKPRGNLQYMHWQKGYIIMNIYHMQNGVKEHVKRRKWYFNC